jgi:hypothetical protein
MQTYKSSDINQNDSVKEKIDKLYVGICSVGEQLYSAGSAVAEFNKKINGFEAVIADFRRDLTILRKEIYDTNSESISSQKS